MRLLILEDEPPIADYIENCCRELLDASQLQSIEKVHTLKKAEAYLASHAVDLCLLDLNLNGEDGFDILKSQLARGLNVIVISAHTDRAIEAFEVGVIDFVPKSLRPDRLKQAFERYFGRLDRPVPCRYLIVKKAGENSLLRVDKIRYFKAERYLVEAYQIDGGCEILEKSLSALEQVLPDRFLRIHRSYIVNTDHVAHFKAAGPNRFAAGLKNGQELPVSRSRYRALKNRLML